MNTNKSNFSSRGNPCFHGLSKVLMSDNSLKNASEIQKGDIVKLANGRVSTIECVLKTIILEEINMICLNENLHITPYHPVKKNNSWIFPKYIENAEPSNLDCNAIYSFVLEKDENSNTRGFGSGMIIGNYECATLGHGILNEQVISHPFFGTELVINNLKESITYQSGLVIIRQGSMLRNSITNLINRIVI
jgi:hypothetical protein